jgi:type II secretory pathway predicted ATPase ExeA/septal ring-binding cell division protein DamX
MKYPSADSDYYHKYDLARDPFPIHTIDNFLYLTPEFSHRLELIKDLVANSEKMVVVTSSPGAGKTILAHHLGSVNEPNWKINLVRANAGMDIYALADAFIQQIYPDKYDDTTQVVNQLHKYLESVAREEKVPVLIIDDAHTLPFEALEFILQLAAMRYGESLFRFALFADVSINDQLEDPKLKALTTDVLHNIFISPFSEEQTKAYINKRLSSCGEIDEPIFTDEVISHIFEISDGLPRGVNLLARKVMQDADAKKTSQAKHARLAVILGIIVILTVTVYILIFNIQKTDELTDVVTIPVPPEQPSLTAEPIVTEQQVAQVQPPVAEQTASQEQPITQLEEYSEPEIEDQPATDEILSLVSPDTYTEGDLVVGESVPEVMESIEEVPVPIEESPAAEAEAVVSETIPEAAESYEEVPVPIEEMTTEEAEAVVSETIPEAAASYEEVPVSTEEIQAEVVEAVVSETVSEVAESLEEEQIPPAMVLAEGETITSITEQQEPESGCNEVNIYHLDQIPDFISCIKGPDWFRQQPSKSYVLQLISSRDVVSVEKLLSGQAVDRDRLSGYTNYTPSGKLRYLLYYGNYPDNKTAKAAIQALPPFLAAQKPWPRTMNSIIEELDNLAARGY